MKDISEYLAAVIHSDHPYTDAVDLVKDDINREIRREIEKALNVPPTPRDKEIENIIADEKKKWEADKLKFESDPMHWDNNKRRRAGLPTLRGKVNKYRVKKFHSFRPTERVFFAIEDVLDEMITDKFRDSEFYNKFVDVKDVALGDKDYIQHIVSKSNIHTKYCI